MPSLRLTDARLLIRHNHSRLPTSTTNQLLCQCRRFLLPITEERVEHVLKQLKAIQQGVSLYGATMRTEIPNYSQRFKDRLMISITPFKRFNPSIQTKISPRILRLPRNSEMIQKAFQRRSKVIC